jgi:molybdate transport system substrate-binding protein
LGLPEVKQFAMANPDVAPYGRAAQQALRQAHLWDAVKAKAVMGQSITQTLQMLHGGTGIGFTHHGALYKNQGGPALVAGKDFMWVDPKSYEPLEQAFVVLKPAAHSRLALAFAAFLLSPACQGLLEKYGYLLPKP